MRSSDIDGLYALLSENQWNMERDYLQCVFDTDPSGLVVVVTNDGQIIGHNGILAHSDKVASSGMNIVSEGYRELGIGRKLFHSVMEVMKDRNVGGTSLSNRVSFYAQFGWIIPSFTLHYNQGPVNPHFVSAPTKVDGLEIVPIADVSFSDVLSYDAEIHTIARPKYLRNWALFEKAESYAALKNGKVCGYSVLRRADVGYKMYPLFADDKHIAHALFCKMASFIPRGEDLIFTQPIENEEATKFVTGNKLTNYLTMTRLYNQWEVEVDVSRVYSTSSTEYSIV
ncbi:holothin acyltransferase-like [Littorina saxatilis]